RSLVKRLILTYDTLIFFSQKMRNELMEAYAIDSAYAEKHFIISPLGVDMGFFSKYSNGNGPEAKRFVVSSGNSARDFDILIRASEKVRVPFKIYCKPESFPKSTTLPQNVEILSGEFPFEQICKDYDDSKVILIPLAANPEGPIGFTSLLEAFAMGKPVIMTRNDYIDVDFHNEKIGMVVEANDVDGWVHAMTMMLNDYPLLQEMGANSLRLGSEKYNINVFARDLATALVTTYQRYISKHQS
ncbi:MAG TPA: glycosyltransferase family 4 protein, partial [Chryseolinea sp.]